MSYRRKCWFTSIPLRSLPSDKILDQSNLKASADDKIIVTEELKFVYGREENLVGRGKNAGH